MLRDQAISSMLRDHGLRVTPQRRAIWGVFAAGSAGHLTAEEVLRSARRDLPELSRTTVYNALNEFVAAGLLAPIPWTGSQLFDANVDGHDHFYCRSCNGFYDVHVQGAGERRLEESGFIVERAEMVLQGLCPSCSETS